MKFFILSMCLFVSAYMNSFNPYLYHNSHQLVLHITMSSSDNGCTIDLIHHFNI